MGMFDDFTDDDRGLLALSMAANMLGPQGGYTTGQTLGAGLSMLATGMDDEASPK